jgi:hypothetical protein
MSLNPFAPVSDYPSMLNKIALYTFGVTLLAGFCVYSRVPQIRPWLLPVEVAVPEFPVKVPMGVLLVAFGVAFLSRTVKLHDRISDVFGIRKRFDVEVILFPMAAASGAALTLDQQESVRNNRLNLMSKVFYRYATSSPGKAVIEAHAITMALDQWSWYWILVEADLIALITAALLYWNGRGSDSTVLLLGVLASIWCLLAVRRECPLNRRK